MITEEELEEILEKNLDDLSIEEIAALEVDDCASCGIEVESDEKTVC